MPTQRIPDPYATLGVPRAATSGQLRAAYRRLAKRHHPDLHADARATQQMRQINQAWEILSSPSRRAEYDASVAARAAASAGHWGGVSQRASPVQAATTSWTAAYGARPVHAGARAYARDRGAGGAYSGTRSDASPGLRAWAGLLLLVPVAVLSAGILSAGILPFPLLGFLVLVFAGRLFGRDG
jgi:curved DNA-binding protein CbpA